MPCVSKTASSTRSPLLAHGKFGILPVPLMATLPGRGAIYGGPIGRLHGPRMVRFASLTTPYSGFRDYAIVFVQQCDELPFYEYAFVFPRDPVCVDRGGLSGRTGGTGVPSVIAPWTGKMPAPPNFRAQGAQRRHRICENVHSVFCFMHWVRH